MTKDIISCEEARKIIGVPRPMIYYWIDNNIYDIGFVIRKKNKQPRRYCWLKKVNEFKEKYGEAKWKRLLKELL